MCSAIWQPLLRRPPVRLSGHKRRWSWIRFLPCLFTHPHMNSLKFAPKHDFINGCKMPRYSAGQKPTPSVISITCFVNSFHFDLYIPEQTAYWSPGREERNWIKYLYFVHLSTTMVDALCRKKNIHWRNMFKFIYGSILFAPQVIFWKTRKILFNIILFRNKIQLTLVTSAMPRMQYLARGKPVWRRI